MPSFALDGAPVTAHVPYRDTRQTMGEVVRLHHEALANTATLVRLRQRVEDICRNLDGRDYVSEALAILNDTTRTIRYRRDPYSVELVKAPDAILADLDQHGFAQEDCESIALWIGVHLDCIGGRVRYCTAAFARGPRPSSWKPEWPWPPHEHAFVQTEVSGRWLTLDPVAGPRVGRMLQDVSQLRCFAVE